MIFIYLFLFQLKKTIILQGEEKSDSQKLLLTYMEPGIQRLKEEMFTQKKNELKLVAIYSNNNKKILLCLNIIVNIIFILITVLNILDYNFYDEKNDWLCKNNKNNFNISFNNNNQTDGGMFTLPNITTWLPPSYAPGNSGSDSGNSTSNSGNSSSGSDFGNSTSGSGSSGSDSSNSSSSSGGGAPSPASCPNPSETSYNCDGPSYPNAMSHPNIDCQACLMSQVGQARDDCAACIIGAKNW